MGPAQVAHRPPNAWSRRALGAFFIGAGVLHFIRPREYEAVVPPYLPSPHTLVQVSGAAEIAGGLAVLPRATRGVARWWLIALLVAVFPANVHMALHPHAIGGLKISQTLLWARLPLQPLLIAWAWAVTRLDDERGLWRPSRGRCQSVAPASRSSDSEFMQ